MFFLLFCYVFNLKNVFFNVFVLFFYVIQNKTQNYKYDAFLMGKLRLVLFSICTIITVT